MTVMAAAPSDSALKGKSSNGSRSIAMPRRTSSPVGCSGTGGHVAAPGIGSSRRRDAWSHPGVSRIDPSDRMVGVSVTASRYGSGHSSLAPTCCATHDGGIAATYSLRRPSHFTHAAARSRTSSTCALAMGTITGDPGHRSSQHSGGDPSRATRTSWRPRT